MIQCVWLDYKNTGLILSPTQQLRQLVKSNSNILDGKLQARLPWKPFAWYSTSTWYLAIVACFFEILVPDLGCTLGHLPSSSVCFPNSHPEFENAKQGKSRKNCVHKFLLKKNYAWSNWIFNIDLKNVGMIFI